MSLDSENSNFTPVQGPVKQLQVIETAAASAMLKHLETALVNLEWACGASSELIVFPETRRLPGLHELHVLSFVPMSYHIVTALGALRLILASGPRPTLSFLAISCVMNTLDAAEHIDQNIEKMRQYAPPAYKPSVEAAYVWARACVGEVLQALQIAKASAGAIWVGLLQEVRQFQEEVRSIRREMAVGGY